MGRVGLCKYVVSVCVLGGERMLLDSERWPFSCPLLGLLTRCITACIAFQRSGSATMLCHAKAPATSAAWTRHDAQNAQTRIAHVQ